MESTGLFELAARLVGFNTVVKQSSNVGMAEFIVGYLEKVGFQIERFPYQSIYKGTSEAKRNMENVNIIARKGPKDIFPALMLSGHMDTVKFNREDEEWNLTKEAINGKDVNNPLKLTRSAGKVFGMGIADMKLFLAIAMKAGEAVPENELKKPFALCFTGDEEVGCVGAKNLIDEMRKQNRTLAERVVIGEPTELDAVINHKGYVYLMITLKGKSGHSSMPKKGKSVTRVIPMLLECIKVFERRLENITDSRFNPPHATINVGVIDTGRNSEKNKIPDKCEILLDIRPIPGQNGEEIGQLLEAFIMKEIGGKGIEIKFNNPTNPTPPMETSPSADLVLAVKNINRGELQSVNYNTEGGKFSSYGAVTVVCGPGSISQAHKPGEFVEEKYFDQSVVDHYINLIRRFCC